MRIGIISDTHNRVGTFQNGLAYFRKNGIDTIFHCGDVTTVETARLMAGFAVHYVYGNADVDAAAIRDLLQSANSASTGGAVFTGPLDGVSIAAAHGHQAGIINELASGGKYDYVFHGHTHYQTDEMVGSTRIINPGALGNAYRASRTLCVLDLQTGLADFLLME